MEANNNNQNNNIQNNNNNNNNQNAANNNNQNDDVENNIVEILNWDSQNPTYYINIAKDFLRLKKYNRALVYIALYLKCYPNSFEGFYIKSQIYTKLYREIKH